MPDATKVIGWGKCSVNGMNDVVEGSTSLSVEEGEEQEALIEGGSAEARKKAPDKYTLTCERRIGDASDVTVGYTENVASVAVVPEQVGAIGVTLLNVSQHIAVSFDSSDGLKAIYTWKTKGAVDANGALTDITFQAKAS